MIYVKTRMLPLNMRKSSIAIQKDGFHKTQETQDVVVDTWAIVQLVDLAMDERANERYNETVAVAEIDEGANDKHEQEVGANNAGVDKGGDDGDVEGDDNGLSIG